MKRRWEYLIPLFSILATVAIGATIRQNISLTSFNAGEMSPLMQGRVDFAKYKAGAKTLQNMIVRTQGPVTRRPGTKYIATAKDSTDKIRLIPFEYSTSDAYILELGDAYMRFYRNGTQVTSGASAYEVNTPWDSNDIFELQFAQDAQTMRIVHPDYPPYKLTRNTASHTDWTLSAISFVDGPFLDENTDHTSLITPSGTTGMIALDCNDAIWDANHVGALWQITHLVDSNRVSGTFWGVYTNDDPAAGIDGVADEESDGTYEANSVSMTVYEHQEYTVTTGGMWWGTFIIQRSYDDGTSWNDVKAFRYEGNGNVLYTGSEQEEDAIYRVRMEDQGGISGHMRDRNEGQCTFTICTDAFFRHGVVKITAYVDANEVTGTVQTTLASTLPTWRWAEGAWSTYRGFPRTIEHHEQRCIYGGSRSWPQTIWGSVTASQDSDYDDFDAAVGDATDAWIYVLPGMNPIQWMKSREFLMIGTTAGVGRLGSPDKPIDPTWPPIYRTQTANGCAYMQPVLAVDALLYVERGGQKVRELTYTYSSDRYIAPDMTILADHITGEGITQIDFQNRPDPILWAIRSDGVLLSFTYQRHQDVEAWARHTTGPAGADDFESIARIPGTNEDQIWAVVKRTINSASVRYIEQFQPFNWGTDQNDCWYVDCGKAAITGLAHLNGSTVSLFADGRPVEGTALIVAAGAVSPAPVGYTDTIVGLPYTSILETMPLWVDTQYGDSLGRYTSVRQVMADFYQTLGAHVGSSATYSTDLKFSDDAFATTMPVFTGVKAIPYTRGQSRSATIYLTENSPVPLTLRSYTADLEVVLE